METITDSHKTAEIVKATSGVRVRNFEPGPGADTKTEEWVVLLLDENDNDPLIIWQIRNEQTIWFKTK
ncbi:hypothetical protein BK139_19705 [Paenibacillus sp. FSL R5-0490]|uniref:hypothetical protein n=1 Tax=Bacillales TaxID=1385 RepID=UPI00096F53F9|nr:hypothetical protein [Paenibacillus sp. FSL R5-0490]OMF54062.1 hypothetical protein BK139_19705 [Paenibacillus sp. FSL R5-0490]